MIKYFSIILILTIIWYIYYQIKPETFTNDINISNKSCPTVYIVWNDKFNIQGLGDKLRGTIAIYQYCTANKIPCIFDARFSIFGKYLANSLPLKPHPKINIKTPVPQLLNVYNDPDALGKFISKQIDESIDDFICVSTNVFPQIPLSLSDMNFLEFIMKPTPELESKINLISKSVPLNHTIQHFRFEDNKEPDENRCEICYQLLISSYESTDILMTNSNVFKKYVKDRLNQIYTIDFDKSDKSIGLHVGLNPSDLIIEFTLIEYYFIKKACSIRTYSQYGWTSAFVYWPAKFYSIPIINTQI